MTGPLSDEAKRALANAHRAAIRNGHVVCECRLGLSQHYPGCYWAQAVAAIYKLERELEGITVAPTGST